jgi:DNA modification methylase
MSDVYLKSQLPEHLLEYFEPAEIGLEQTPEEYIAAMVEVFRCVRDVLADDGTLWLNIGDSYAGAGYSNHKNTGGALLADGGKQRHLSGTGFKNKDLIGIPWMLAFALRADGWYLRQDIIWHKPNPMPESVRDRCTKAHEYVFLLSKSGRYFFDPAGMKEPAVKGAAGSEFHTGKTGEHQLGRASTKPRSKADSFKRDGSKREQTIPGQGYGTHRPDRKESSYSLEVRNRRSVWTVATRPYNGKKALTDYVGADGKPYTASPDCPIHGHLSRKKTVGTRGYGGQQDQPRTGSVGTDSRHAASPACDEQSTNSHSSQASSACNSEQHTLGSSTGSKTDSPPNECISDAQNLFCNWCNSASGEPLGCEAGCSRQCSSSTATFHSTVESKTDRDLATNQPCTPCAETDNHTQSKSNQHGLFEQDRGIYESSILKGETSVHPSQDTRSCNAGTSSELASMAYEVGKKCNCNEVIIDHFATFPPALIEPCILAGSRPGDIVLDCFMGSGTTAAVSLQHGRKYLGCELNPEYGPLQDERIAAESNLFNTQVCGEQQ